MKFHNLSMDSCQVLLTETTLSGSVESSCFTLECHEELILYPDKTKLPITLKINRLVKNNLFSNVVEKACLTAVIPSEDCYNITLKDRFSVNPEYVPNADSGTLNFIHPFMVGSKVYFKKEDENFTQKESSSVIIFEEGGNQVKVSDKNFIAEPHDMREFSSYKLSDKSRERLFKELYPD